MNRIALIALGLAACVADAPGGHIGQSDDQSDPSDDPSGGQDPGEPTGPGTTGAPDDPQPQDSTPITTLPAGAPKQQLAYVVIPHPDDEWEAWSLIEKSAANYPVFILLTHGEETSGCRVASDGTGAGPYWYQGAGSPVGQPDLGENVYGNPWQGRWEPSCDAARLSAFHLMLDRMAQFDSTLPYQPPYVGRFCFGGTPSDGAPATRVDNGTAGAATCAEVYANASGARVIFDLGDGDLRPAEVIWALQAVRANRAQMTIPALPEHEVLAAAFYNATAPNSGVAAYASCDYYGHTDHHAIQVALWNTNVGAGPQYGRTCDSDPDVSATGGRFAYVDVDSDKAAFEVDPTTQRRLGASVVAYGWLNPTVYASCGSGCGFSRKQSFWRR